MMNFILDFVPVLLFFIAFKFYGVYVATMVGIVATAAQVVLTRLIKHYFDNKQIITLILFLLLGGMTLYFHNPIFVKWKPTAIFWVFALISFASQFIGKKPLIQRMAEASTPTMMVPAFVWRRLNMAWAGFFLLLGAVNIYVAYYFSTNAWVNFKLYGIFSLLLIFCFIQAIYLARYLDSNKKLTNEK